MSVRVETSGIGVQVSLFQGSKPSFEPEEWTERAVCQASQQQDEILPHTLGFFQLASELRYGALGFFQSAFEPFGLCQLGLEEAYFEGQELVLHPQGVYIGRCVKVIFRQPSPLLSFVPLVYPAVLAPARSCRSGRSNSCPISVACHVAYR